MLILLDTGKTLFEAMMKMIPLPMLKSKQIFEEVYFVAKSLW